MTTELNSILTRQEKRIAKLIAEEKSEKMIAAELFISPKTVPVHKKNIRKKLGVKSNVGVAIKYLQSLDQPKKFVFTMLFLLIQSYMVFTNTDYDVRRVRCSKKVRKYAKK